MSSGWGKTLAKQSLNILLQLGDDQRSLLLRRRPLSSAGRGEGTGTRPCGWNEIGLLREIASAMALAEPGMCWAEMATLKWAVKKKKQQRR